MPVEITSQKVVDANPPASQQITAWLTNWREGDMDAQQKLFAAVYPGLFGMTCCRVFDLIRRKGACVLSAQLGHLRKNSLDEEPLGFVHFFVPGCLCIMSTFLVRRRIS